MPKPKNERYYRLTEIIGQKAVTEDEAARNRALGKRNRRPRPAIEPLIPISASAWWAGVRGGRYPQPIRLGDRITVWKKSDIDALLEQRQSEAA
jgi:predicted DNA-binding transcriptional regulator AlpA